MRFSKQSTMRILGGAAFILLAISGPTAGAASLTVNGYTLGEQVAVYGSGRAGWVNTAELDVTLNGANGYSYCVDLAQDISVGTSSNWTPVAKSEPARRSRQRYQVPRSRSPSRRRCAG